MRCVLTLSLFLSPFNLLFQFLHFISDELIVVPCADPGGFGRDLARAIDFGTLQKLPTPAHQKLTTNGAIGPRVFRLPAAPRCRAG